MDTSSWGIVSSQKRIWAFGIAVVIGLSGSLTGAYSVPLDLGTIETNSSGSDILYYQGIAIANLDGDGDDDLLVKRHGEVLGWWEHRTDIMPPWSFHSIAESPTEDGVFAAANIDGDSDIDVVVSVGASLEWISNDDGAGLAWVEQGGTVVSGEITALAAGAIDGDGNVDIVVGTGSAILWLENSDGMGGGWVTHEVATADADVEWLFVAPLNGDAAVDILSVSDGQLSLHTNGGQALPLFTTESLIDVRSARAADADGDGDIDVILSRGEGYDWLENQGPLSSTPWKLREIGDIYYAPGAIPTQEVMAAGDVDGDGNAEFVGWHSARGIHGTLFHYMHLWENDGLVPPSWEQRNLLSTGRAPILAALGDSDGDGDTDIVDTSWIRIGDPGTYWYTNAIDWYQNLSDVVFLSSDFADLTGDGQHLPGEPGDLVLMIENQSGATRSNATASVTAHTPGLSFVASSEALGDLEGGAQVAIALDYMTEDTATCGDPISAEIMVSWDGGSLSHTVPAESFGLIRTGESSQSESPGASIPDNDLNGLERSFTVSAPGALITGVTLSVNITHPFVSDLQVTLQAPTGEISTVFDPPLEQGGEDLVATYPITALNGLSADGTFVLKIVDRSGGDVGTLNSWSLTVQHETLVCEDVETRVLQHLLGDPQDPATVDTNSDQTVDAADLVTAVDLNP